MNDFDAEDDDDETDEFNDDDDDDNELASNSTLTSRAEHGDKPEHKDKPKPKPKHKNKGHPAHPGKGKPGKGKPKKGGPRYVVYADNWLSEKTFPSKKSLGGYTHFNLAFWMSQAPKDNALSWTQMSAASRKKLKKGLGREYTKLMVSAFGATEQPTTQGKNAIKTAHSLAQFVKKHDFDGVDVDYEDLDAFNSGSGKAEKWLIDFTRTLRKELGPKKIISHAPLAPWFQTGGRWHGGGYLKVHKEVGKMIDFYNIQFYNRALSTSGSCKTLMEKSDHQWPKTSVMEIIKSGVPGSKIVVGKPAGKKDATNGFMGAKELGQCLKKYHGKNGFTGSAMVWQWANAGKKWVQAVRGAGKGHGKPGQGKPGHGKPGHGKPKGHDDKPKNHDDKPKGHDNKPMEHEGKEQHGKGNQIADVQMSG
ncbi:glycoside hydrolase superfamily [Auriculariales sp. MPI-PUGE-AT-0066]|nr:glycoside hydrolase superfamily [Auriculariales sp. MPI-PUGE-AT-0066]